MRVLLPSFFHVVVLLCACAPAPRPVDPAPGTGPARYDLLLTGGTVLDGSGAAGYRADVAVRDERIVRVSRDPLPRTSAARIIDATGKIVAPGFIDMHAHLDPLLRLPDAESHVRQGVTTALGGPDGGSPWPLGTHLDSAEAVGVGINVAFLVGHNTIRREVMGMEDRAPTAAELERMRGMVARAMGEGAWGLSTGLKYLPGAFSEIDEVVALSEVAADSGGIYTSHLREEGLGLLEGVAEAIEIGGRAGIPVVLTHHKVVGQPMWGSSTRTLAMVDSARAAGVDVMIDQYPYTATYTGISVLVPAWAQAGGDTAFARRLDDPVLRDSIEAGIVFNILNDRGGGDLRRVQFARVEWLPDLEGRTLHDWALRQGLEPTPETGAELVIEAMRRGGASAIYHALDEDDVERIMQHPQTMIASDGRLTQPGEGHPHPRWYGTFPRVLGRYVREQGVLSLEEAVHKMTGLPAARLGLRDRGRVGERMVADLVVFDPVTVIDNATFQEPHQYPEGIDFVIVNGVVAVDGGEFTGARAGRVLRHGGAQEGSTASSPPPSASRDRAPYDVIIRSGRVLDGSGNPWFHADVAIRGDRVAAIGDLTGADADRVIDAAGLYVAPGFIDVHSHAGGGLATPELSAAEPLLAQGVTTVMVNPDGGGWVDIAAQRDSLLRDGLGVNVAQFVPHGSVRREVLGMEDRAPTTAEMERMKALVRRGMEAGAFGLSSGPYYAPGSYSTTEELIELAEVAAEFGGAYSSHIRDEADYSIGLVAAVDEVIRIAREAGLPGVVTHIKALGPRVWGFSHALIHRIERARAQGVEVYADQYPYTASATGLTGALVPRWAQVGGDSALIERINTPGDRSRLRADIIENLDRRGGAERIQFRRHEADPSIEGRTLAWYAEQHGLEPADAVMELLEAGGASIVSFNMNDADVAALMRQPWTMTGSDGDLVPFDEGVPHPRSYGAHARKIRLYVVEEEVLDLPAAIRGMTSLPASVFRIRDRGVLREGAYADLVVFDLERVNDPATFQEPHQLAEGMVHVLVNGQPAIENGRFADDLHGTVLNRAVQSSPRRMSQHQPRH